jgi:16S rRNA G1207 methylase RsmC
MSIPKKRRLLATAETTTPTSHYFDPAPAVASKRRTLHLRVGELALDLQADRGVFGSHGVDLGTLVLLKEAPPPPSRGEILDLGAGYGPIAIAIARQAPDANVWAVDINQRALELTMANAATARVTNVTVATPEQVPEHVRFAAIYSNPPVRVGKAALHELLLKWLPRLQPGGPAYLVVQRNLGADSLSAWLATQGFQVTRLKAKKGYRVLQVTATATS